MHPKPKQLLSTIKSFLLHSPTPPQTRRFRSTPNHISVYTEYIRISSNRPKKGCFNIFVDAGSQYRLPTHFGIAAVCFDDNNSLVEVLKTRDYIHVEQQNPYDNINIKPRGKLMKYDFSYSYAHL